MASIVVYLVLYLYLHACTARPLMVWEEENVTQLELSSKYVNTSVAERLGTHNSFRAGQSEKTLDHDTSIMQLDNQKSSAVKEAGNYTEGDKVKISYPWKVLQQATETKTWKRVERSTVESPACNSEETVNSNYNDKAEDVVVMDYAQPHRKPPIHNKGT